MTRMNAIYKKIYKMKNHSAQILKKKKTFIESMAFFIFVFFWKLEKKEERSEDKGYHPGKYVN